jgi:hypothetical protein
MEQDIVARFVCKPVWQDAPELASLVTSIFTQAT